MELGVGQAISWATFKEEFNDRFFPKMVQEEKKKAKKLERGLNPRIRTQIVTTHFFFFENIQMSHHSGMTMFH
jgi:hypothetical protein